jgi:NAD(P)-dependent dehydrogenase (short-subunit alcohol dehydrogenase family)
MLAGDIVIAADTARFCQLESKRGIAPLGGAHFRYLTRTGWGNAMYHLFLCDEFDAEEALRIGFVQEVHPYGKHRERAMEIARRICKCAPVGLRATKKAALTYLEQGERRGGRGHSVHREGRLRHRGLQGRRSILHRAARSALPGALTQRRERSNVKPVCLVIGAGAGIGGNVARRFAQEGYHACLCRRSDRDGLSTLVDAINEDGGSATGFLLNAVEPNSIEDRVAAIEADIGPIEVAVYNLGAQIGDRALKDTSAKAFETGWRLGTFGLFRLASALCPLMEARGKGTILVTSSTAAMRGNGGQHSHAAAMGGRRMLCQSLNAEFASKGIHVVHIVIDGAVDAPDTLGKMLGRSGSSSSERREVRNTTG